MTAAEYKQKGFQFSTHTEQPVIDRAERDVQAAYIDPICASMTAEQKLAAASAIAAAKDNLVFLLVALRNIFATYSGGALKPAAVGQKPNSTDIVSEQSQTCAMYLRKLSECECALPVTSATDICRIYFSTNYLFNRKKSRI